MENENEAAGGAEEQTMSVYLRVRPFFKEELSDNEDQDCIVIETNQMVTLKAPKGSATMKSSEKGVGTSLHKFSFSQIFGPETTQAELFEHTVKSQMNDFLGGTNALIFSYGVTNAGKTHTIQGTPKDPGILPRVLDATFQHIEGRQYEGMDLKPYLRNDAQYLTPDQVKQERSAKAAIFASVKEECDSPRPGGGSESLSSLGGSSSSSSGRPSDPPEAASGQFALWVAFFEIYNESVFDLLQPPACSKSRKRASLRVCDDGAGNAYVKDLSWVNVQNRGEAFKLLHSGNKNRSAAATKMNQSSSRSHSIFTVKLLKIEDAAVKRLSEFSLCDLAGSERCNRTKTFGERLKEAGNINSSLLILGKCITALRHSQADRAKSSYVPFRESKLTKLFQAFFCGRGQASMIVNVNQCASTYDETLHVMKFSAVAKQVVQVVPEKPLEPLAPCLVCRDGKPLVRTGLVHHQAPDSCLPEEELLDEEEEADVSLLPQAELVDMIESLRGQLGAERRRNLVQEMEIRKEMGDAMLQQLMESEERRSQQIEELKETYQEKLESTFEMYKDAIKEHAYQSALSSLEDDYVPLDDFLSEQQKVEAPQSGINRLRLLGPGKGLTVKSALQALKRKVSELEALRGAGGRADRCCQTQPTETARAAERCARLSREKRAVERMCEEKQELILSLERRLMELTDTLEKVRDRFLEKSTEVELLQKKADDQATSLETVLAQKDGEIASLKAELAKMPTAETKAKRGLLANIKEAVTSPRKGAAARTLRKTLRTPHH